ncbi:MAG: SpvB/TcaC N-terminal domain-containing protein [Myxococcota bacterium]
MELVQVGTSIDGDVYRTVPDEHMEITRLSDGLAAWRVRTKTGRVSYYGASPESRVAASMFAGFSEVVAWDLSRVEDKHGNHVSFLYDSFVNGTEFGGTREHYLAEVRYTGHAEQEGIRFVRFNYRPRADVTKGYVRWVPVRISRLLQSIEMHAPDGTRRSVAGDPVPVVRAVRRYNLSYLDLASHRASLVGLEECVLPTSGASVCKPTVEFDYSHHTSLDFPSDGADPVEFANLVYNDTTAHAPANAGDIDGIPGEELLQMRGSEPLVLRISRDRERQDRGIVNAEIAGL